MNPIYYTSFPLSARFQRLRERLSIVIIVGCVLFTAQTASAQAVTGIITDYKGYWKSTTTSINPVKPDNSHNLVAFSYNGVTYSTGVNDALLAAHGESFVANDFWSLPAGTISGAVNGNTKIGLGQLYDGVDNGASTPAPVNGISRYLTDGVKGLDLGTCVANLPAGSLTFLVSQINPSTIGDGIPDILVTQVADPSGSSDRYEFTDASGTRIGNYKDIVFTAITPVANWTADFYEASANPMTLSGGYTKTDRQLRLWAADLSEFGVTVANYASIKNFKIGLSGNSDVAFVGYSSKAFRVAAILPVTLTDFTATKTNETALLKWNTQSESNSSRFVIEKSYNGSSFASIDSIKAAGNSSITLAYSYTDKKLAAGTNYYRLRMVDEDGKTTYSLIVSVKGGKQTSSFNVFPNPASSSTTVSISHTAAQGTELVKIYNTAGLMISQQVLARGSQQTKMNTHPLPTGAYYIVLQNGSEKVTQKLLID